MAMKLKIGVSAIILSTVAIIGTINFALDRSIAPDLSITTKADEQPLKLPKPSRNQMPRAATSMHDAPQDEELFVAAPPLMLEDNALGNDAEVEGLTKDDLQKINGIINLTENDLVREFDELKNKIEAEDLFARLEDGELSEAEEVKAKETLERFALLGLETTRRKYVAMEPELKDPIYAFKDSLLEIRELLNDDFEDE